MPGAIYCLPANFLKPIVTAARLTPSSRASAAFVE